MNGKCSKEAAALQNGETVERNALLTCYRAVMAAE